METNTTISKHPTGVPGLDVITHGGIPRGRATLITGKSGAGKSILALQLATQLARAGIATLYVAVEERPDDIVQTGESLGLGIEKLVADGSLSFVDMRRPIDGPIIITGEYDTYGLVARLGAKIRQLGARAVVLDSVSAIFHPRPAEDQLRAHFFLLVQGLEALGVTVIMTTEASADYSRPTMLGVEDYVCDLVLVLRNVVDGKRRRRTIEVHKYRRSAHRKGEYPCTIAADGITIFPLDADSESAGPMSSDGDRFSSGMTGLDEMNAGGWLRNSIVLVRGPSGSGKTTIAGMYARAGGLRGERVVYYGFEEPRAILLRNFASLDLDMQPIVDRGHLRFVCVYPEATSPEDLLIALRRDLDEFDPSLVVLDSISAIEHSTSVEGFRIFMIGFASLLRQRARSALLTQTISSQSEARQEPPFLSTVADAILMLDYAADAPKLERTMRVLKMRGSAHDSNQRRLTIGPGGLYVAPST